MLDFDVSKDQRCAPGRTRTAGTRFRKPLLYPPELRGHMRLLLVLWDTRERSRAPLGFHHTTETLREQLGFARSEPWYLPRPLVRAKRAMPHIRKHGTISLIFHCSLNFFLKDVS